mgnify:CR=1 FL=1
MEHLLDNITFLQDKILLRGYVFGVIHAFLIVFFFQAEDGIRDTNS